MEYTWGVKLFRCWHKGGSGGTCSPNDGRNYSRASRTRRFPANRNRQQRGSCHRAWDRCDTLCSRRSRLLWHSARNGHRLYRGGERRRRPRMADALADFVHEFVPVRVQSRWEGGTLVREPIRSFVSFNTRVRQHLSEYYLYTIMNP